MFVLAHCQAPVCCCPRCPRHTLAVSLVAIRLTKNGHTEAVWRLIEAKSDVALRGSPTKGV